MYIEKFSNENENEYITVFHFIINTIYFKVCRSKYRICSNRTRGKYEYGVVLQLIIQLIYFKVCSYIYSICSNTTQGK